ncbi:MAG: AMP-binding protein, partial [Rhodospirillaceae bacterium]|nr:AMP-binding protein [Rhodospirillaceae bacterium]
ITPINWHLTPGESAYIVDDCEAHVLFADADCAAAASACLGSSPKLKLGYAIAGALPGFASYDTAMAGEDGDDLDDPVIGERMLYTSGTTGRPKGVKFLNKRKVPLLPALTASAGLRPGNDILLNPSPLYHAAPMSLNLWWGLNQGMGMVLMERFEPEQFLALIEQHRISHSHVVPVMFQRLLDLPEKTRNAYDISSLRWMLHGSAPCSAELKNQVIAWLGPILHEFFGGTEGALVYSTPRDWASHPGTVGKTVEDGEIRIVGDNTRDCPNGTIGAVYLLAPETEQFVYYKAPKKTHDNRLGDWFTMGDMGYVDDDGYLYLTGRNADTVVSGGVNIYPAEIDLVLNSHPAVKEAVCVGVPSERWSEEIKAVIELNDGFEPDDKLAQTLIAYCRENIAAFKVPKSVDFTMSFPRSSVDKVLRRELRDRYWPKDA